MRYLTRTIFVILVFILAESVGLHFRPIMRTIGCTAFDINKQSKPFVVLINKNNEVALHPITCESDLKLLGPNAFPVSITEQDSTRIKAYYSVTVDAARNYIVKLRVPNDNCVYHYAVCGNQFFPYYREDYYINMQAAFVYLGIFFALLAVFYLVYAVEKKFLLRVQASKIA